MLKTAGNQWITATDTVTLTTTGTLSGIKVSPAAASQFLLSGLPSTMTAGLSQTLTVTALDPYGNVATAYTGIVDFTSSDPQASLPASYAFPGADQGVSTFRSRSARPAAVGDGDRLRLGDHGHSFGNHGAARGRQDFDDRGPSVRPTRRGTPAMSGSPPTTLTTTWRPDTRARCL